eukprot:2807562-Alexandrium_andersonii.AAC.1
MALMLWLPGPASPPGPARELVDLFSKQYRDLFRQQRAMVRRVARCLARPHVLDDVLNSRRSNVG